MRTASGRNYRQYFTGLIITFCLYVYIPCLELCLSGQSINKHPLTAVYQFWKPSLARFSSELYPKFYFHRPSVLSLMMPEASLFGRARRRCDRRREIIKSLLTLNSPHCYGDRVGILDFTMADRGGLSLACVTKKAGFNETDVYILKSTF